jgi:hypothetical protein
MATKKKQPKERQYKLEYWNKAGSKITETMGFENENEAHKFLYRNGFKILNVKFAGWK